MQRKGSEALTGTELNAAVYRYLQDSGFVHTAFNFFYEADIERGNIQGMIPQGTLIRIVHKGLEYIELEANSEIGSDDEHHFFDTLDLMTNDLDELRKKVTSSSQWNSVKNDKEQKINSGETDKAQCSAETTTMYRKKPTRKTEAVQNTNPDETAAIGGTQPMKHFKAQNISSAETAQKTGSAETTTGQPWQISWIGKKPRLRK
ncbi:WD40 repeat-containing protein HOS15 [Setaria italica]|uniref:WD40 repeat-containing protein HOS15 n=1 Tax=Setaria italica TaxID=4555 RepID=UPI000647B2A6|nr:WD40 repeat-containing protein HOS15 [Setaria italica]